MNKKLIIILSAIILCHNIVLNCSNENYCTNSSYSGSNNCEFTNNNNTVWMNIFIHGIVGLKENLNLCTIRRIARDKIAGSEYEKNVNRIRANPYLYSLQPMQEFGLLPVTANSTYPRASYALSRLYELYSPKWSRPKNLYYTFGWDGFLSATSRYKAAKRLYISIKNKINILRAKGYNPKVRIIGYSHGGTIALTLSAVRKKEFCSDTFPIDEVITLGMPVLQTTQLNAENPMYKRIYNIYSRSDTAQRLDIFNKCNIFSRRKFHGYVPNKIIQIELKLTSNLTTAYQECLTDWSKTKKINHSPDHSELWFFGWASNGYRRDWILYPLPGAALVPYVIEKANQYRNLGNNLIMNIDIHNSITLIAQKKGFCEIIVPFISFDKFKQLRNEAFKFNPNLPQYSQRCRDLQKDLICPGCGKLLYTRLTSGILDLD